MKIKCIAIDDEPLALKKMASYISKTPFLEIAGLCRSGYEAMDLISKVSIDLMFVDINMPDINGLDLVRTLQNRPQIIFTTAFGEYAIEGFKLDAIDYLLKPIGYNEFLKAANKARVYFESVPRDQKRDHETKEYLFVKTGSKIEQVLVNDIVFIEGMREYVRIHLDSGKSLMPLISLRLLEEQLPSAIFMRVHRSYIVNLTRIKTVEHNRILIEENVRIPVSDQYKDVFHKFLNSNSLG